MKPGHGSIAEMRKWCIGGAEGEATSGYNAEFQSRVRNSFLICPIGTNDFPGLPLCIDLWRGLQDTLQFSHRWLSQPTISSSVEGRSVHYLSNVQGPRYTYSGRSHLIQFHIAAQQVVGRYRGICRQGGGTARSNIQNGI